MTTETPDMLRQIANELDDDARSLGSITPGEQCSQAGVCREAAAEIEFLQVYRTDVMAQVKGVCDINESLQKQIKQLRESLEDCVSVLLGQISGITQKEGIIREATVALDASALGEQAPKQEG